MVRYLIHNVFCDGLLDSSFSFDSSIARLYTTEDLEKDSVSLKNRVMDNYEGVNASYHIMTLLRSQLLMLITQ